MAVHSDLTPAEAADRLALRELFDAYAHCADRRDAEGQKALFTADSRFAVAHRLSSPWHQSASTSSCSASTFMSSMGRPVTTLMTPPGTSLVSKTWYKSPAISGYAAEGTATTQFPAATNGSTNDRNPSSGVDSGQITPTVPSASFIAREMFLNGGE